MNSSNHDILIALISAIGGLGIAVITSFANKRVQVSRQERRPKDRMEMIFDGYEKLIMQQRHEIEELKISLGKAEARCERLEVELENLRHEYQHIKITQ